MMNATEARAIATTYARICAVELANKANIIIREKAETGMFFTYYKDESFTNPYVKAAFQNLLESCGYNLTYSDHSRTFCIDWEK